MNKKCDGSIKYGNGDHAPDCGDGSDENIKVCCSGLHYEKYTLEFCES